ncbi:hypothetical protein GGR54DRAFT_457379 [Hypoxylon sp. NC1633]|nr:hypothetical protein GGR54DRAFT_457379 [Hypoxylon sp. NC1633]
MAEAALAAVGVTASAIQLGDAALRLCRSISDFIGELKDAKDDMRHLRSTLDDTSSLVRNLVAYIHEFRTGALASAQYEVLPDAVVGAVRHFHDSLAVLRECLPPDLSPGFAQKFRFVFNRKKIQNATRRLEECKTSASLALNIVGSRNNIRLHDDLRSLKIDSEAMAASQQTAANASWQQGSELIAAIQDVSQQQSGVMPKLDQVDKRTSEITSKLQSIYSMMATQEARAGSLHSAKTFTAVDEDALAKIVRVCVSQTVQVVAPEMDREAKSTVDNLSSRVASQAYDEKLFQVEVLQKPQVSALPLKPTETLKANATARAASTSHLEPLAESRYPPQRSSMIELFERIEYIRLRWVTIRVCVAGLRRRQTDIHDSDSYFSIDIEVLPRRLVSFGLALSYTSAPDDGGYYSICPRLLTFGMLADDAPVWDVIRRDDVDTLRRMIRTREINLRDCDMEGDSLLMRAVLSLAVKSCQFLHNEWNTLKTRFNLTITYVILISIMSGVFADTPEILLVDRPSYLYMPLRLSKYLVGLQELRPKVRELHHLGWQPVSESKDEMVIVSRIFLNMWEARLHKRTAHLPLSECETLAIQFLQSIGMKLRLFSWFGARKDYDTDARYHEFCLDACLTAGANPSADLGWDTQVVPLELAVSILSWILESQENRHEKGEVTPRLLVLLIKAGADVSYVREVVGRPQSITDLASKVGIADLWEEALRECGLNPKVVYREDEKRRAACRRLHQAERSGVDVESIIEASYMDGLRHRVKARS